MARYNTPAEVEARKAQSLSNLVARRTVETSVKMAQRLGKNEARVIASHESAIQDVIKDLGSAGWNATYAAGVLRWEPST